MLRSEISGKYFQHGRDRINKNAEVGPLGVSGSDRVPKNRMTDAHVLVCKISIQIVRKSESPKESPKVQFFYPTSDVIFG